MFHVFRGLLSFLSNVIFAERRKEEDYDEEVEEDLQDEVQLHLDCFFYFVWSSVIVKKANGYLSLNITPFNLHFSTRRMYTS